MGKRVLYIVMALVLIVFAYVGYNTYDARRAGGTGDVFSRDSGERVGTDSGSGAKVTVSVPEKTPEKTPEVGGESATYPAQAVPGGVMTPTTPAEAAAGSQVTQAGQSAQGTIPEGDTINPNPPNGMKFAGTGKYQLYRQGNITWRLNTDTGQSCIIFATDEEWKKPRVYRAGCGGH
jgi:hypothetical protein